MSWDLKFYEPIPLPGKRKPLVTLRDAVKHMTGLPRQEQAAEHWRPAPTLLGLIGENGGCVVLARIAVMYGCARARKMRRKSSTRSARVTGLGENGS